MKKTKPELYREIAELKKELGKAMAQAGKIFAPHHLKTIEVDTENKVFKVNGEDFGIGCTGFSITCTGYESFSVRMEIDTCVRYIQYEKCKRVSDVFRKPHSGISEDILQERGDQFGQPFDEPDE